MIVPAKTSITPTAMTMAATMTATSRAMPTAVITESSENTTSSNMICTIAPVTEEVWSPGTFESGTPSIRSWISRVDLPIKNNPPTRRIKSRPEKARPTTVTSG